MFVVVMGPAVTSLMHSSLRVRGGGGCLVRLFPVAVRQVLDLLLAGAAPYVLLADVDFHTYTSRTLGVSTLSDLTRAVGIPVAGSSPDGDVVVLRREDVVGLLLHIGHWNLHCWDAEQVPALPGVPERQRMHREVGAPGRRAGARDGRGSLQRRRRTDAAVRWRRWTTFFLDSHDDTDLSVECHAVALARAVLRRAVAGVAQRALGAAPHLSRPRVRGAQTPATPGSSALPRPVAVADPPEALIEAVLGAAPDFGLWAEPVPARPTRVRLAYGANAKHGWNYEAVEPSGHLEYDTATGVWRHRFG